MTIDHNHKKYIFTFRCLRLNDSWLDGCGRTVNADSFCPLDKVLDGVNDLSLHITLSGQCVIDEHATLSLKQTNDFRIIYIRKDEISWVLMPRLNVFEKFLFRFDSNMEVPFVKKYYTSLTEQWRNEMRFQVSFCNKLQAERHNINVVSAINSNIYINSNIIVYKGVISLPTALFFLWIRYTLG